MTHTDIAKKLIGPITPVGDANIDPERLQNLKEMFSLVEGLIDEIRTVAKYKISNQHSVKEIGLEAALFLKDLETH